MRMIWVTMIMVMIMNSRKNIQQTTSEILSVLEDAGDEKKRQVCQGGWASGYRVSRDWRSEVEDAGIDADT